MNNTDLCSMLVQMYADYKGYYGSNDDYARAVAVAVAALSGFEVT